MKIMVTNIGFFDEDFRRKLILQQQRRAAREGLTVKRIRFTKVPAPRKPISRWENYVIELVTE